MVSGVGRQLKDREDHDHCLIFQMNNKRERKRGRDERVRGSDVKGGTTLPVHRCARRVRILRCMCTVRSRGPSLMTSTVGVARYSTGTMLSVQQSAVNHVGRGNPAVR